MTSRSDAFYNWLNSRRTVRDFSSEPIPPQVIDNLILAAGTAPSGANKQPWTFCVVTDPVVKQKIREAAEAEEYENYTRRMSDEWLNDLKPFGTDHHKPFLEYAPALIVVMKQSYDINDDGERQTHYYVNESVGIAVGMLLSAIHNAGLVALTHTPSPMMFLKRLLNRPKHEQPFLLIPIGKPAEGTEVPDIHRKTIDELIVRY